jgi:hypothetical protein
MTALCQRCRDARWVCEKASQAPVGRCGGRLRLWGLTDAFFRWCIVHDLTTSPRNG